MADQFNYDSFFSANSLDSPPGTVRHSKYDFAVAYPDPDVSTISSAVTFMLRSRANFSATSFLSSGSPAAVE